MFEIFEFEARLKDLVTAKLNNIIKNIENVAKKNEDSAKRQKAANNLIGESVSELSKSWDVAKIAVGSLVGAIGTMSVLNTIRHQILSVRTETQELIKTNIQQKAALGYVSEALQNQSSAFQKLYVIDDEVIRGIQTSIAYFTKDENQIMKLTEATLNFAAATGMDARSAAMILGRSVEAGGSLLTRYGIRIKETNSEFERADLIIDMVNRKFGGQARALAESKDAWDALKLTIADTQQALGMFFKGELWKGTLEKSGSEYIAFMKYNYENAKRIVAEAEKYTDDAISRAKARIQEFESDPSLNEERIARFKSFMDRYFNEMNKTNAVTIKLQEELLSLTDAGKIKLLQKQMRDELNNTTYTEEQKVTIRQIYMLKIDAIEDSVAQKRKQREKETYDYVEKLMNELQQAKIDELDIIEERYKQELSAFDRLEHAKIAAIGNDNERESSGMKLKHNIELAEYKNNAEAKKMIMRAHAIETEQLDKKHAKQIIEDDKTIKERKIDNAETITNASINLTGSLMKMSKKAATMQKVIDIAQASANTAIGVSKAVSHGIPAMYWEIPIALTTGLAAVASVAAQKYQYGGIVPGNLTSGDRVPAALNSREMILTLPQQAELFNMITGSKTGNNIHNDNSNLTNTNNTYNIDLKIDNGGFPSNGNGINPDALSLVIGDALARAKNEGRLTRYESMV